MIRRLVTLVVIPVAAVAAVGPVAVVASLSAQSREGTQPRLAPAVKLQPGETAVPGECLTRQELDLNTALAALTRPTRGVEAGADADDVPRFNPNYFVGKWTLEGVLPESPLGPAGDLTGAETIRHVDGCTYEGTLQAKGAGGAFTVKTLNVYDRRANYFVRLEQDSRGFQLLKPGAFGSDSGGYFNHHWESTEFTYKGRRVRLTGTTFLASPDRQRVRMQISVDGQPAVNFGTLWWTREGASRE